MTPRDPAVVPSATAGTPRAAWVALFALVVAFALLGARGIWDPDEGRYSNVAMMMIDHGNWIDLARHHETGHWTKPPLTYWAVASSIAAFGPVAWAARLPIALSFLACVFATWRCAERLWPGRGPVAALAFSTMLLPALAAQLLTTDFPLAAAQSIAMWCWLESYFATRARDATRWHLAMWAAFAIAFLAKGPPALLPLTAIALVGRLAPPAVAITARTWLGGALVFCVIALPWFVVVIDRHPGLLGYFLGTEVYARVAGDMHRNPQWYGWLVYVPTLALGTVPWSFAFVRWWRDRWRVRATWRTREARVADAQRVILCAWVLLPLVVFCVARSRLPLYLLPLFVPIALIIADQWANEGARAPRITAVVAWIAVIVGLRVAAAAWPTHKDAAAWADAIRARADGPIGEVIFVDDMARYGLHLHLGCEVERISMQPRASSPFGASYDDDVAGELREGEPDTLWVMRVESLEPFTRRAAALGFTVRVLGTPHRERVFARVAKRVDASAPRDDR